MRRKQSIKRRKSVDTTTTSTKSTSTKTSEVDSIWPNSLYDTFQDLIHAICLNWNYESSSKGERHTARVLRRLFPFHYFHKCRPHFLRNPLTGRCLELDFFCRKLKVAIEYQGRQHYEQVDQFQTNSQFHAQLYRDSLKRQICEQHGITLIEIPYSYISEEQIEHFLRIEFAKRWIRPFTLPNNFPILSLFCIFVYILASILSCLR